MRSEAEPWWRQARAGGVPPTAVDALSPEVAPTEMSAHQA